MAKNNNLMQNQSITISKAVLRGVGNKDKININFSPIMIVNQTGELPNYDDMQEMLWAIINALPHPKLRNLRKLAMKTCLQKIPKQKDLAKFLQMQRTYMSQQKSLLSGDPLFNMNKEDADAKD